MNCLDVNIQISWLILKGVSTRFTFVVSFVFHGLPWCDYSQGSICSKEFSTRITFVYFNFFTLMKFSSFDLPYYSVVCFGCSYCKQDFFLSLHEHFLYDWFCLWLLKMPFTISHFKFHFKNQKLTTQPIKNKRFH